MSVSILEQAKIQARVLVPLLKAMQAELGEERASAIVRKAIGDAYRKMGDEYWRAKGGKSVGEGVAAAFGAFAAGQALDYEVAKQTADAAEVNVTGCRYAEFYQALGAPELGFLLVCGADLPFFEGFPGGVGLARTQTIMQGASHCDFRFARKSGS
jgi:hypothetical protein